MPAAELLAINDHLAGCLTCRELFEEPGRLEATYNFVRANLGESGVEAGPHLDYHQIVSYTDELLSDRERSIVDIHLEACRTCEAELDDLRRTRAWTFPGTTGSRDDAAGWWTVLTRSAQRYKYAIPLQVAIVLDRKSVV